MKSELTSEFIFNFLARPGSVARFVTHRISNQKVSSLILKGPKTVLSLSLHSCAASKQFECPAFRDIKSPQVKPDVYLMNLLVKDSLNRKSYF